MVRVETIDALRKIGDSRAIPRLISLLTDENLRVKVAASKALKGMTGYYSGRSPTIRDKLLHLLLKVRYESISQQELAVLFAGEPFDGMWLYVGSVAGFHYLQFVEREDIKGRYRIKESELPLDCGFPYSSSGKDSLSIHRIITLDGRKGFSISKP